MNYEETRKVLTLLKTAYPNSYTHLDSESSALLVDVWNSIFANMPVELVSKAVKSIIATDTREFAPNPADINKKIVEMITDSDDEAALKAWEDVVDISGAMHISYYSEDVRQNRRLYGYLPKIVWRIYSVEEIAQLGLQDIKERDMYEKPRFLRLFKSLKVQEEEKALTTGDLSMIANRDKMQSIGLTQELIDQIVPKRLE